MNFSVYCESTGEVLWSGTCLDADYENLYVPEGAAKTPRGCDPSLHYVCPQTTEFLELSVAPTRFHIWDWQSRTWLPDLAAAVYVRKKEVDEKLTAVCAEPVTFQGSDFDADDQSQAALLSWVLYVASGAPLPAEFTWRDARNLHHPADAQFLQGLSNLIALRRSAARVIAWKHKQTIDTLSDIGEVLAYPTESGWGVSSD